MPQEFSVGDLVFLKVSSLNYIIRFGKRGKFRPRIIGLFEISERVGEVAYHLAIPPRLSNVHDVFDVSMFHKYKPDHSHGLSVNDVDIDE